MAEQPLWKIPLAKGFDYGQHIALKQGLLSLLQDTHPGTEVHITIKKGDKNGFYVRGTREAADHVAGLMSKRSINFFTRRVEFEVDSQVDTHEDISALDENLIASIHSGLSTGYNAAISDLSSTISGLRSENERLRSREGQLPEKSETVDNLVSILSNESSETAQFYDTIFDTVSMQDIMLSKKSPAVYAHEKATEAAKQHKIPDWESLRGVEIKPYEQSEDCVIDTGHYKTAKAGRNSLIQVIVGAPENVKGIVESALNAELERMSKTVNDYESAETEHNQRMDWAKAVQKAYSEAEKEQAERIKKVKCVQEFIDTLSGAEVPIIMKRNTHHIHVTLGNGPENGSAYFRDLAECLAKASKGFKVQPDLKNSAKYSISCADPVEAEKIIYNRLVSNDSCFSELGMRLRIVQLP